MGDALSANKGLIRGALIDCLTGDKLTGPEIAQRVFAETGLPLSHVALYTSLPLRLRTAIIEAAGKIGILVLDKNTADPSALEELKAFLEKFKNQPVA